ncbi:MAG: uracil-DNA glycosylase [Burkholderiales bacterium]|nr:uracil-DNA glycosylase [Burkholderiales bacterium]
MAKTIHDLLIGNLWQPRPEQIHQLQDKFDLARPALSSLKTIAALRTPATMLNTNLSASSATALTDSINVAAKLEKSQESVQEKPSAPALEPRKTKLFTPPTPTTATPTPIPTKTKPLIDNWHTLVNTASNCEECNLWQHRTHVVIERGNRQAKWMFIGKWSSEQDDLQAQPILGSAGQLLDKMITAMQLNPENEVYITNLVKCRPLETRNPTAEEISCCSTYLMSQINLIKPQIIITLGSEAAQTLLNLTTAINKLRQQIHYYHAIPLIVTYHPDDLLRSAHLKKGAWEDLQFALRTFQELN